MKAFVLSRYGGPEVSDLREVACPKAGPGQVLVRVKAGGLNPVDYKTREGQLKAILKYDLPATMGQELAGVVEDVGEGVTQFSPGDRVFARAAKDAMGAFAEFAAVDVKHLARMPGGVDFTTAAGVPLAALTALQALRGEMRLGPGGRVFISAGAGGVGTFAIQVAAWLGAEVITTASPRGRALVERLGADRVIDYTREKFEDQVHDVDAAFDLIGGDTLHRTFGIVRKGGVVVSISALPEPETAKDLDAGARMATLFWFASIPLRLRAFMKGVRYRFLFMRPSGSELAELAALIDDGLLEPIIDRVFPFDEIADAMAYLEKGHAKGKVVVRMAD